MFKTSLFALAALCAVSSTANARYNEYVNITIDVSEQVMYVQTPEGDAVWPVSTGKNGYDTPVGDYQPTRLEEMWYSKKYDDAPMPHSIFFKGGYAIHGTEHVNKLGRPASHGCVRLSQDDAMVLYEIVDYYGMENTFIRVQP